jgi:hypothetical protein
MELDLGHKTNLCHPSAFRLDSCDVYDLSVAGQDSREKKLEAGMVFGPGDLLADLGRGLSVFDDWER